MPTKTPLSRYLLILNSVKENKGISLEELQNKYRREVEFAVQDGELGTDEFSKRTLQRDMKAIRSLFHIDIGHSKKLKGYTIRSKQYGAENFERMLEAFDVFKAMQMGPAFQQIIFPETRKAAGTQYISLLMHCIPQMQKVEMEYQKFDQENSFKRVVNPVALKEFKNRWYLLAFQDGDLLVKTYGLDRIKNLKLLERKFDPAEAEDWKAKFEYVFGISTDEDAEPQEIVLSFSKQQGKYLKTLHLHPSQKVILETETETRISVKLCLTFDLEMELLSHGEELTVIEPKELAVRMKNSLSRALKNYQ